LNPTHKALRAGTAEAHERVDKAFAAFDLTDRDSYARFLRAHAELVLPLEDTLPGERIVPDWEDRKRGALLREDLAFLRPLRHPRESGGPSPALSAQDDTEEMGPRFRGGDDWELDTDPAIAGALYVLEGSRLGGRFLVRQVPHTFPRAYLDADQPAEKWRNLLDRFDTILYQPARLQSALAAAHTVFAAFERSAQFWAKG
jgi:heme oxygenase